VPSTGCSSTSCPPETPGFASGSLKAISGRADATLDPVNPSPVAGAPSRTVDVDGATHYLDMGGFDDGPLMVFVHGLGGSHLNWTAARRMSAAHPDWRFEVASDIGHVPMLEAPGWTATVIEDWMTHQDSPAVVRSSATPIS
jgi:hypothetical protein